MCCSSADAFWLCLEYLAADGLKQYLRLWKLETIPTYQLHMCQLLSQSVRVTADAQDFSLNWWRFTFKGNQLVRDSSIDLDNPFLPVAEGGELLIQGLQKLIHLFPVGLERQGERNVNHPQNFMKVCFYAAFYLLQSIPKPATGYHFIFNMPISEQSVGLITVLCSRPQKQTADWRRGKQDWWAGLALILAYCCQHPCCREQRRWNATTWVIPAFWSRAAFGTHPLCQRHIAWELYPLIIAGQLLLIEHKKCF